LLVVAQVLLAYYRIYLVDPGFTDKWIQLLYGVSFTDKIVNL